MYYTTSVPALLTSIASLVYFFYVLYHVASEWRVTPQAIWIVKKLEGYEHFFMIAQINMIFQVISLILHVMGHFSAKYRPPRDFVFGQLAFPFSISTMVSFWTFWFLIGKQRVYPQDAAPLFPFWVTHGFHSVSPGTNLLLLWLMKHNYNNHLYTFSYCFMAIYFVTACIMYITTGSFEKAYIEKFTNNETAFYYCAFAVFAHFCYMCGVVANNRLFRDELVADIIADRRQARQAQANARAQ